MRPRFISGTIAVIAALTLAACSSGGSSGGSSDASDHGPDDVMFAQMMIPHHEQAIELSDIALDPTVGSSEIVRDLATRIKAEQDPEIAFMKEKLTSWNESLEMTSDMDHSEMMKGMLTIAELDELSALRGAEFDARWIESMILHHEGAIAMAEDLIESGKNAELIQLAREIIEAQKAEIEEMKALS